MNSINKNYEKIIQYKLFKYIFLLLIIYSILLVPIQSFKFFSSFNFFLGDIIILSDEGIFFYNAYSQTIRKDSISSSTDLGYESERNRIAFSKFPNYSFENYTICTFGFHIYLLKDKKIIGTIMSEFDQIFKVLIPYKIENGTYLEFIVAAVKNNYLYLQFYNSTILKFEKQINFKKELGGNLDFCDNIISCQLMYFKNSENFSLICFTELSDEKSYKLSANIFDIENNFTKIDYKFYLDTNNGIGAIKSITSDDKKRCYICYVYNDYKTECVIYNSEDNSWGKNFEIYDLCFNKNYFIDFFYLEDIKEYIFYCFYGRLNLNIFSFDNNFNLKKINGNNGDYSNKKFNLEDDIIEDDIIIYTSSFVYLPNDNKYFLLYTYNNSSTGVTKLNEIELCIDNVSLYKCQQILNESINNDSIENSSIKNNIIDNYNENITKLMKDINFTYFGNIFEAEINITKKEMANNLDNIIKLIEIGNSYKIAGTNYDIIISPLNSYKSMNSTYVDFEECSNILREKYNLSSKEIITILQIEIKSVNEKVLNNQIEYTLFDEERNKLDLSFCQSIPITIDYKIKNSSLINKTMISFYSDLDIDIFNIKDSFFNDICYSFSDHKTDLVLNDRVNDIYQNYSLCENNCAYKKIDVELSTVKCQCKVKEKIDVEVKPPVFSQIIKNSFIDSNFGVIKCFNKVFSFSDKINNLGFWISIIIFSLHIPLFITFFIYRIKSIKDFIFKEMEKNNYINKINYPPKIKVENYDNNDLKNIYKNENKESLKLDKIILNEVNSNRISKIKRNKKYKKIYSLKNSSNLIKYNVLDSQKTNELLSISEKKDELILSTSMKKGNPLNNEKKEDIFNNKIIDNEIRYSHNKKTKFKQNNKKVQFYDSKNNNKKNNSSRNLPKKKLSKILVYKSRRSQKGTIPTSEIFKKLLGNEESKSFPGFYNLIHVNANNNLYNRPLDSKYILDNYKYDSAIKYDDRSFWRIYFICLLSKENILNTFFLNLLLN